MSNDLVKRLRKNVMCGDAVIEEAASRIEKLEDELHHCFHRINELQTALTPFLKLPIGAINDDPPEMEVYQCHGWPRDQRAVVTVADFRRVRKALEEKND